MRACRRRPGSRGACPPPSPVPSTDLTARARWGGTGFEAIILNEGVGIPATQRNPTGAPVWVLGLAYQFQLDWAFSTGTITWAIDFNRNGSFGSGEIASFVKPGRELFGFQYVQLNLTSAQSGINGNAIDVTNFTINGTNLGNFTESGGTPFLNEFFARTDGLFQSLRITGEVTFHNTGGTGAFAGERPSMNISLVGAAFIPEPGTWAMMIGGFGLVGSALRIRRQRLA